VSFIRRAIAGLAVIAIVAGCNAVTPSPSARTALKVGLGYIPNVQFAQFYYAERQGYYREAGLDVTFQNGNDAELTTLIGQGAVDIGISDGTSVIPAASQGIPIKYVATIYGQFPSIVLAKATAGITTAAAL
jgi:NitT/TauT family transport system substrate-binding protein